MKVEIKDNIWKELKNRLMNGWVLIEGIKGMDLLETEIDFDIVCFPSNFSSFLIHIIGFGKKTPKLKKYLKKNDPNLTDVEFNNLISCRILGVFHNINKKTIMLNSIGFKEPTNKIPNFESACDEYLEACKKHYS